MAEIWNEVVNEGTSFPQTEALGLHEAEDFFAGQSLAAVAAAGGEILGLYILHPNNVGRCAHIANASYAVKGSARGMKVGERSWLRTHLKGEKNSVSRCCSSTRL